MAPEVFLNKNKPITSVLFSLIDNMVVEYMYMETLHNETFFRK